MNDRNFTQKVVFGGGFVFDFAKWLILIIVILVLIQSLWISVYFVDGVSMDPTFKSGEIAIMNRTSYSKSEPQRGDVVAVKYPGDPEHKRYVKRVIGLPGEEVSFSDGKVFINGKELKENYLPEGLTTDSDKNWTVPAGSYFCMGDNRLNSNDSRYFGAVEKRFIIGKTIWIIFPRFFAVTTPSYL